MNIRTVRTVRTGTSTYSTYRYQYVQILRLAHIFSRNTPPFPLAIRFFSRPPARYVRLPCIWQLSCIIGSLPQ